LFVQPPFPWVESITNVITNHSNPRPLGPNIAQKSLPIMPKSVSIFLPPGVEVIDMRIVDGRRVSVELLGSALETLSQRRCTSIEKQLVAYRASTSSKLKQDGRIEPQLSN
jgi:hypothetical protein